MNRSNQSSVSNRTINLEPFPSDQDKEQKSRVIRIALLTALCIPGDLMLYIVLPLYWEDFGLTAIWQIGILLSINRLIRLPLTPLIGFLYRRIHLRTGIFIAVCLTLVTTLAYGFAQNFILLVCARALWGIAWSLLRLGGLLTVMTSSNDQNRGYLMGRYNGLWGLGGLVGMISGGVLISYVGPQGLSIGLTALAFCSFFLLRGMPAQYVTEENNPTARAHALSHSSTSDQIITTRWWRQRNVFFVLVSGLMMSIIVFGIFLSTLTVLIDENISTFLILGMVLTSTALSGLLQAIKWSWDPFLAPWIGKLSDNLFGRKKLIIFAFILGSLFLLMVTFPLDLWMFILCIFAFQLTSTMIVTLSDSTASDVATNSSKIGVMTSYTVAVDVGAAIGPLIAFFIIEQAGVQPLYWLAALIYGALALMWTRYKDLRPEH
ncbi:MFS transporter [Bacillus horti]|uniref:MFS family permease n=1 Tax=Caldalkalibacillus horti TaxID=77523 RepID=A0ABT9W527_9BACI|nr:MFS transporter [Bacillus horti]MDQ0168348.1 MFS family permease [Bacillus horti]